MAEPTNIEQRLNEVLASTNGIREQIRDENKIRFEENLKRDRRIRLSRILIALVLVMTIGALYVGFSGRRDAHNAKNDARAANAALASYVSKTQEARVNFCKQTAAETKNQITAEKKEERARQAENNATTRRVLDILGITPAQLAQLQHDHLVKYDRTVDRAHRIRDCSTQGINDYLAGRGGYLPLPK